MSVSSNSVLSPRRGVIRALTTANRDSWHAVLESIGHFDFYHTADYHALEESREAAQAELLVYAEGARLMAVPLLVREIPGSEAQCQDGKRYDARSVYGYVGWIGSEKVDPEMARRFGEALRDYLHGRKIVSVFARMHPLLDSADCGPSVGTVDDAGSTIAIPLHDGLATYEAHLTKSHRYEIRKLREIGCVAHHDRELQYLGEFVRMYTETMTRLGAKSRYYFSEEDMRRLFASDQFEAQLYVAQKDGVSCAMSIMVRCQDLMQYHLSCSRDGVVRYPATKLMLDYVCREAGSSGVKWLHLGGGFGSRQDSLFAFKLGFGGTVLPFKTWKWNVRPDDYDRLAAHVAPNTERFFPRYRFESP